MRKIILFLIFAFSIFAQDKSEEILKKLSENCKNLDSVYYEMEMNVSMIGNVMKSLSKVWIKGDKYKMISTMPFPGYEKPIETVVVFDGKKMYQFTEMTNIVNVIDIEKMPKEIKEKFKNSQKENLNFGMGNVDFSEIKDIKIEEKEIKGKKVFCAEIKDVSKLVKPVGSQKIPPIFKKIILYINSENYYPEKVEFYGEAENPGMWIEFKNIEKKEIPSEIFKFEIPKDAKVLDMTENFINLFKNIEISEKK